MNNSIKHFAIGDLLDGRYFYIPAYQRGYRWTEKQVGDLLKDLLTFANSEKEDGDFYSLQPIIARPITDNSILQEIFDENIIESVKKKGVWEIIDGQQRLTTLYLIYKYFLDQKGWDTEALFNEEDGKILYNIIYATREESSVFLENMSMEGLNGDKISYENVDYYFMSKAFQYVDTWIKEEGKEINIRYKLGGSLGKVRDTLFTLLNGSTDTKDGSVQVLWYELAESRKQNAIEEFQKINTGKIRLTDAELIKGLFLLKRNFDNGTKYIMQSQIALEWEFIENTLHADNFWYFLQRKGTDIPNRIDFIFSLIYKIDKLENTPEDKWKDKIEEIDKQLQDKRESTIFRYYDIRFEGNSGDELQKEVSASWEEVMSVFRTLDDWYSTPELYNLIGLLSQCGEDLSRIIVHFNKMPEESLREDFKSYLVERVRHYLSNIEVDVKNGRIDTQYSSANRKRIYNLLLTLNIHHLNEQNIKSSSDTYKFPFDLLNNQDWDIEHIDSYSTNKLKSEKEKLEWIYTALADLKLDDEKKQNIDAIIAETKYDDAILLLKEIAGEEAVDEELKNSIGNLALLDSKTNRSYGNSLFCTKRRIIIDSITNGVFIPIATQYVFAKFFDPTGTNRSQWSTHDMEEYHKYVYDNVKLYLKNN
ncbi:MAG: DUF262 domain-containing protein [Fermentimonas sp.]|nr:DUF262 domain-containing protein [Fermentimonas sp.]